MLSWNRWLGILGFRGRQFPIQVCWSMPINKAQGQLITGKLGNYLKNPCLSHGKLYHALSRASHPGGGYIFPSSRSSITAVDVGRTVNSRLNMSAHLASVLNLSKGETTGSSQRWEIPVGFYRVTRRAIGYSVTSSIPYVVWLIG